MQPMHSLRHACMHACSELLRLRASRHGSCKPHASRPGGRGGGSGRAHTKVALIGVMAGQALHGTQVGLECLVSLLLQSLLQAHQSLSQSVNQPQQLLSDWTQEAAPEQLFHREGNQDPNNDPNQDQKRLLQPTPMSQSVTVTSLSLSHNNHSVNYLYHLLTHTNCSVSHTRLCHILLAFWDEEVIDRDGL